MMADTGDFEQTDADIQPPQETVTIQEIAEGIAEKYGLAPEASKVGKVLKQKTEIFSFDQIRIEKAYQRNPNEPHILGIKNEFDPDWAMMPIVIRRRYNGGEIVAPEGQQRLIAECLLGYAKTQCIVIEADDIGEEAEVFRRINIHRKAVPTPVTHRNDLLRGDESAIMLERTVRAAGFRINERDGNRTIKGISRLRATGRSYGYPILGKALEAYGAIWPEHRVVHLYLNSGLAMLLFTYLSKSSPTYSEATERDVNLDVLAHRIQRRFPEPKSVVQYTAPQSSLNVRSRSNLQTGGRPNETYRRENDFWYARTLITGFNKGKFPKGTRALDLQRVFETYMFLKGKSSETDEDAVRAAMNLG